jgi:nitroreductase
MKTGKFVPLTNYREYPPDEMKRRAEDFYNEIRRRRSVREFSDRPVDREIIEQCLLAAGTAPNGANLQPWQFVVVSEPALKKRIRVAAEAVESDFYNRRAPKYWLEALAPLGTDEHKEYLEIAPYLIVIFSQRHTVMPDGSRKKHYYIAESVGIATGILITALHTAGLACLTHTPSPMAFLRDILERPKEEDAYLILVVGYPKEGCQVPQITKKSLDKIAVFR